MEGDEAFYYQDEDGELKGVVITHVDDFTLAGTYEFVERVLEIVCKELTISKITLDTQKLMYQPKKMVLRFKWKFTLIVLKTLRKSEKQTEKMI